MRAMAIEASATSWRYSPNAGHLPLREAIADLETAHYDPEREICITAGTQEGLYAVFQSFVEPGDEVLIPDPGFVAYAALARLAGGLPRPYPLDPETWSIDPEGLEKAWTP